MTRSRDHSSKTHPPLKNEPGKTNWVEKAGGLPSYMVRIAKHIRSDSGYTEDAAIASAVNRVKELAAKGNPEAIKALAQWERMKAKSGGKKTTKLSNEEGRGKLLVAAKLYKKNKGKLNPKQQRETKARILKAARDAGLSVYLSHVHAGARVAGTTRTVKLATSIGTSRRPFDESKFRRVGGRFAQTPDQASQGKAATTKGKPQTAKAIIEGLGVGAAFNIPEIDGRIKRTEAGYEVTGPNGFKTTASTATAAMAVAARLLRQKSAKGTKKTSAGAK